MLFWMPIYEYRCECGALLESIDRVGTVRERCGELCLGGGPPPRGEGRIERVLSAGILRGDGHEATEPTISPVKRANRPGGGCDDCE